MPGRDGTGPRGLGSRTGWGWGDCKPEAVKDLTSKMDDSTRSIPQRGEMWNSAFGWWFRRRRGNRNTQR
jgi:hypothetical protein